MLSMTICASINFVLPILKLQPVAVTAQEPALTAANIVLQTMLAPPFRWAFNRRSVIFPTVVGQTDYTQVIANWGFLETQWLSDPLGLIHQLNGKSSLAVASEKGRPTDLAIQYDDNVNNITFRVKNAPDKIYIVHADYQAAPPNIQSFAQTWGNVSDQFGFVYNLGFLTMLSLLVNDSRFPIFERWFLGRLLGVQDGITDQERDIFLGNWTNLSKTITRAQGQVAAGSAGRGQ
jgi:hypothetical protein